jgi:hypothetical protein
VNAFPQDSKNKYFKAAEKQWDRYVVHHNRSSSSYQKIEHVRAMAQESAKLSFQFFKHYIYKNIEKCIEKEQLSDPTISMSIFSILLICSFSLTCLKLN